MNRAAQGVVLFLVGGGVLRASLTDLYLRYVKEGLRPLLIAAGVVLVLIAAATLVPEFRTRDPGPAEPDVPGDPADHDGHPQPAVSWLLVLPVLALLLAAPPALGADAASRSGTVVGTAEDSEFPPLPEADPARLKVYDYAARAVFEKGLSLGERRVELSGFILVGADGQRYLARMVVSCCASDARPVKVGLSGRVPPLPEGAWVRVVGRYSDRVVTDPVNNGDIPFLDAESVRRTPEPKKQYE